MMNLSCKNNVVSDGTTFVKMNIGSTVSEASPEKGALP